MAHEDASDHGLVRKSGFGEESGDSAGDCSPGDDKLLLNRREYAKLGAAAVAAAMGPASGLTSAANTRSFTTDFSEYAE